MTPKQIRDLLRRSVGKPVSLRHGGTVLSGTIHGLDGSHLLVKDEKGGRLGGGAVAGAVSKWGTPEQDIAPQYVAGKTVFAWHERIFGEGYDYTLTIG